MSDRFRPTRAGVINVWDYVDEEWMFADGRLALRGHNGSGKTKALEVLFPFVLDGVADSRRLDPFSGENRTMKSNLLYRGQESEYGYVWMEFARSAPAAGPETVTLIIGMRAHRNTDGVRMSFYVTGRRLGADFGLLSADSRPLTERQLRAVLEPDAWRKTATEYRDLLDARLFGLGRERYAQLLDLLLALRRPLLAKDLDPVKVSDTLTAGLSPVDEHLVQQAARDFENLAAVQKLFDDLTAAHAAVRDFLAHYAAYLRAHVRFQLDRVQARTDAAAGHAQEITEAASTYRRAVEAERQAEAERNARRGEGETLQGRLAGLKNSEEYKAQGRIEDKRREMLAGAREVAGHRGRLDRDRRELGEVEAAARKLGRRAAEARTGAERYARDLADAAQRSGIADDGFGPVDSGDELMVTSRARVAARRDDVGEIRGLLEAIRKAKDKRGFLEQDLGRKQTAEHEQEQAGAAAAARLARHRQTAAAELAAWTGRWAGPGARTRRRRGPRRGAGPHRRARRHQPHRGIRRPHRREPGRHHYLPRAPGNGPAGGPRAAGRPARRTRRGRRGAGRRAARQRPAPRPPGRAARRAALAAGPVRRRGRRRRGRRRRGRAVRGGAADRLGPFRSSADPGGAGRCRGGRLPDPVRSGQRPHAGQHSRPRGARPRPAGRRHRGAALGRAH